MSERRASIPGGFVLVAWVVSILLAVEDTDALKQGRLRLVEALVTGGIKMSGDVTLLLRIQGLLRDLG